MKKYDWDTICKKVCKIKQKEDVYIGEVAKRLGVNCGTLLKELSLRNYKVKRKRVKRTKEWSKKIGDAVRKYDKIDWDALIKEFLDRREKDNTFTKKEFYKEKKMGGNFVAELRKRNIKIPKAKVIRTKEWNENIRKSKIGKIGNPKGSNGKLKGKLWTSEQKDTLRMAKENSDAFQESLVSPEKHRKKRETLLKNYSKWREKMEQEGKWMSLEKLSEYERYKFEVGRWTRINDLSKLENYKKKDHQLDHIFSKKEGFLQKIEPKIIGNIVNLRYIKAFDNNSKGIKCDITKGKLLESYKKECK